MVTDFDGLPFIISWELTLECNLRCYHCGSSAGFQRTNELKLDESLAICDQFPDLLVQEVDFTGGEPLVSRNFLPVAKHLQKLDILTQVITNGLMLQSDFVDEIKDSGIAAVGVSLDGLETCHDDIRGHKGLFRRVLAGIEHVHKAGLPLTVLTTANALNLNELPSLLEALLAAGVQRWQIQPIFPLGRGQENEKLQLTEQQYLRLGSFVQEWKPEAKRACLKIELADSYGYFTKFDLREVAWKGCPAGLVVCGITSDGKIKGCLSLPDNLTEGDLRHNDLWDIWFDPNSFAYNRKFSEKNAGSHCKSCDKISQCKGGCSAMSYGCTGNFHNDPFCFYRIESDN